MAPAKTFKKTDPGTAKVCNRAASEHGLGDQAKSFGWTCLKRWADEKSKRTY